MKTSGAQGGHFPKPDPQRARLCPHSLSRRFHEKSQGHAVKESACLETVAEGHALERKVWPALMQVRERGERKRVHRCRGIHGRVKGLPVPEPSAQEGSPLPGSDLMCHV